jgi:hypothetical protein
MRRAALMATFALLLAFPAWCQMRGGAPARSAGIARSPSFAARPGFAPRPAFTSGPHMVPFGAGHQGFHGCINCFPHHHHHHLVFNPWWYGGYGYPYTGYSYAYGGYWPTWDTASYGSNDDANYQRQLVNQIDDLSRQVQELRQELDAGQYRSAKPAPAQPQTSAAAPAPAKKADAGKEAPSDLTTVLVFRDQRIQEVKNYAIVGKTLVVIADQRQRKVPLSDLDLETTMRLNEERGVSFQIPR